MNEDPLSVENTLWANTVLASGECGGIRLLLEGHHSTPYMSSTATDCPVMYIHVC